MENDHSRICEIIQTNSFWKEMLILIFIHVFFLCFEHHKQKQMLWDIDRCLHNMEATINISQHQQIKPKLFMWQEKMSVKIYFFVIWVISLFLIWPLPTQFFAFVIETTILTSTTGVCSEVQHVLKFQLTESRSAAVFSCLWYSLDLSCVPC